MLQAWVQCSACYAVHVRWLVLVSLAACGQHHGFDGGTPSLAGQLGFACDDGGACDCFECVCTQITISSCTQRFISVVTPES